jgi:hypothetical protein
MHNVLVRKIKISAPRYYMYFVLRGRVSKYDTNGSKKAVMDVISIFYVSLGSSTVQIHDSLGNRQYAHVQRLVSVVKMATVLEEYTTEEQHSVVRFMWVKELGAKVIHKEMFPVYSGTCLSRKTIHNWVADVFADSEEVETEVRKWLRQQ